MRDHVYPQPVRRLGVEVDVALLAWRGSPADAVLAFKPEGECYQTSAGPSLFLNFSAVFARCFAFTPFDLPLRRFFFFVTASSRFAKRLGF